MRLECFYHERQIKMIINETERACDIKNISVFSISVYGIWLSMRRWCLNVFVALIICSMFVECDFYSRLTYVTPHSTNFSQLAFNVCWYSITFLSFLRFVNNTRRMSNLNKSLLWRRATFMLHACSDSLMRHLDLICVQSVFFFNFLRKINTMQRGNESVLHKRLVLFLFCVAALITLIMEWHL